MTQIIIVGGSAEAPKSKRIKFKSFLANDMSISPTGLEPESFKYIELICKDYCDGADVMFAYDDPKRRKDGVLFVGDFGDGIV